jgi:DNA invertase Pin-like site-specific DNA recombinase
METKKNIGIWIRFSTDFQEQGNSLEHREERAKLYAKANVWYVVEIKEESMVD